MAKKIAPARKKSAPTPAATKGAERPTAVRRRAYEYDHEYGLKLSGKKATRKKAVSEQAASEKAASKKAVGKRSARKNGARRKPT